MTGRHWKNLSFTSIEMKTQIYPFFRHLWKDF